MRRSIILVLTLVLMCNIGSNTSEAMLSLSYKADNGLTEEEKLNIIKAVEREMSLDKERQLLLQEEVTRLENIAKEKAATISKPEVSVKSTEYGKRPIYDVVDWNNLRKPSGLTAQQMTAFLKDTNLESLGEGFIKAEEEYKVNAIFLAALAMHESNDAKSRIAVDKLNLFGYKAYDADPYNSAQKFGSLEEGIFTVAKMLSQSYLTPGGKYFNGYSIDHINIKYATDKDWGNGIIKRANAFLEVR